MLAETFFGVLEENLAWVRPKRLGSILFQVQENEACTTYWLIVFAEKRVYVHAVQSPSEQVPDFSGPARHGGSGDGRGTGGDFPRLVVQCTLVQLTAMSRGDPAEALSCEGDTTLLADLADMIIPGQGMLDLRRARL